MEMLKFIKNIDMVLKSKQWYIDPKRGNVFFYKGLNDDNYYYGYGFDSKGIYQDEIKTHKQYEYEECDLENLNKLFRDEAERRGFVKGSHFLPFHGGLSVYNIEESVSNFDGHTIGGDNNGCIFHKGKWGKVIEVREITKEKAEQMLLHTDRNIYFKIV